MKNIFFKSQMIFLFFISQFILSQVKSDWKTATVCNGNVEISFPKELKPMTDEMYNFKYRMANKPELCLSDESMEISLIGSLRQENSTDKDLEQILKASVNNLKIKRPDAEIIFNGVKIINDKKIAIIKFTSQAIDQKVFNYMFFTSVNGKTFMASFNCIETLHKKWEPIADEIINTIKVKN